MLDIHEGSVSQQMLAKLKRHNFRDVNDLYVKSVDSIKKLYTLKMFIETQHYYYHLHLIYNKAREDKYKADLAKHRLESDLKGFINLKNVKCVLMGGPIRIDTNAINGETSTSLIYFNSADLEKVFSSIILPFEVIFKSLINKYEAEEFSGKVSSTKIKPKTLKLAR